MAPDLKDYELIVAPKDKPLPAWATYWTLKEVYLSDAVLALHVRAQIWGDLNDHIRGAKSREAKSRDAIVHWRDELREVVLFVKNLALEYGVMRPVVVVVDLGEKGKERENGGEHPLMKEMRRWGGDQDWHRGAFNLHAAWEGEVTKTLIDFLALPAAWKELDETGFNRESPQSFETFASAVVTELGKAEYDEGPAAQKLMTRVIGKSSSTTNMSPSRVLHEWWQDRHLHDESPLTEVQTRASGGGVVSPREEPESGGGVIQRVRELRIRNFRGFGNKDQRLPTDADIVLLAGPNGHGKSSFIEALDLLLNEHQREFKKHHSRSLAEVLLHGYEESPGGDQKNGPTSFQIVAGVVDAKDGFETVASESDATDSSKNVAVTWSCEAPKDELAGQQYHWAPKPRWHRLHHPAPAYDSKLDEDVNKRRREYHLQEARALESRLSCFYQDDVWQMFDEIAGGRTLREVYYPRLPEVRDLDRGLSTLQEAIPRRTDELDGKIKAGEQITVFVEELEDFADIYGQFRDVAAIGGTALPPISSYPSDANELADCRLGTLLEPFVKSVTGVTTAAKPERYRQLLETKHDEALQQARATAAKAAGADTDELATQLLAVQVRMMTIVERWPQLDDELRFFEATQAEQPALLDIFLALSDNCERWAEGPRMGNDRDIDSVLPKVLAEVRRVVADDAGKCAHELGAWLGPRRAAQYELGKLKEEKAELERVIRVATASKNVVKLRQLRTELLDAWDTLCEAWGKAEEEREAAQEKAKLKMRLEKLGETMKILRSLQRATENGTRAPEKVLEVMEEVATPLLRRLTHGADFAEVSFVPTGVLDRDTSGSTHALYTKDKRPLTALSTGQRSQLAVALMLAQNRIAENFLSHRVILLDDLSSSYDLANLAREAVLWRQVAYAPKGATNNDAKRQLFIGSHHEDMTSHLLDLLAPPAGYKMMVLRFVDWKKGVGPTIEAWEVEPQMALDSTSGGDGQGEREKLAEWMEKQLCTSYS